MWSKQKLDAVGKTITLTVTWSHMLWLMMMINQIYSRMQAELMASGLCTSNVSNPAFSPRFPLEFVLQTIDPVFD